MNIQRFSAQIERRGRSGRIRLPFDPDEVWGERSRHSVAGTIAERPWRGKTDSDAAGSWIALGPVYLRDNEITTGEDVVVELWPEGPQMDNMAEDIVAALTSDLDARSKFEGLTTYCRKNYLRWIDEARQPGTRARRINEMLRMLKDGETK